MGRKRSGKSISEQYRVLDEVEHVLARPGMYLGQVATHTVQAWVPNGNSFALEEVTYSPGLLKLFDEIITNSVDESARNKKLDAIDVTVSGNVISVRDNGGIPVTKHPEHRVLVPELVFSNLRAGSNFDDSEERVVAGTHGLGSTLTNIFSKRFSVATADGSKHFEQVYTGNMASRTVPKVKASRKRFTEVSFEPDYGRFGLGGMDVAHERLMRKRVSDLSACNPRVSFTFNGERVGKRPFKEYAEAHGFSGVVCETAGGWSVAVGVSADGYRHVSFVNSAETRDGGTHLNFVVSTVVSHVQEHVRKKHGLEVRPGDVRSRMAVVLSATVMRPSFSTQTKDKLVTPVGELPCVVPSAKLLKQVLSSGLVAAVVESARNKAEAEEAAEVRKLSKGMAEARVERLVDARGRDRSQCSLGVFEGLSALAAVRRFRDAQTFGAFPLKGKFLNVAGMRPAEVMRNAEASDLMAALGLRPGEPASSMRYGRVLVYTDADTDGSSIFCLVLNFLARFWPELFDQGRVLRVLTPLAVARRGQERRHLYTQADVDAWKGGKGWELEYKKGLASLEDEEYEGIIRDPVLVRVDRDGKYLESLDAWFGDDVSKRKERLMRSDDGK